jgi:hypothetical protein
MPTGHGQHTGSLQPSRQVDLLYAPRHIDELEVEGGIVDRPKQHGAPLRAGTDGRNLEDRIGRLGAKHFASSRQRLTTTPQARRRGPTRCGQRLLAHRMREDHGIPVEPRCHHA